MCHFPIHIDMILFILDLSPHGFVFELFSIKISYQLDVIHAYILITLFIPNRCGILWDFRHIPNNYLLKQSFMKPHFKPGFPLLCSGTSLI